MTHDELKQLALGIHRHEIWIGFDKETLDPFNAVFALMKKKQLRRVAKFAAVYEEMSKALPICCNGNPMFVSCRLLHQEDFAALREMLAKLEKAVEEL